MSSSCPSRLLAACGLFLLAVPIGSADDPPRTGPATEKRFPPLRVPDGFRATLFACDPLIEYPSAIAAGPRPGTLFVAVDYLTGLGTDIVRRDEIRLIEDTDGDGYADKATVFATGLNSVQGLVYHDGTLFVMNAPYLTALRDTKGAGKADEKRQLLTGLGLPPEKDQIRLHNANGVVVGHDGWLYLAVGDRGCDVTRPEGDRLVLEGGGILRCRPDGHDLHVFATGLRNIYDVALDDDLNVFVRDNENDGGDYKIRVCHSFFGADHGYPYLYYEHPDEALPPLADLGLGSSAGGVCYQETQFPAEYRGNLFFCEWGRAVVRYPLKRAGASFEQPREIDFAWGAPNDPYGFKPTDLVVDRDGSLFISDWADGQRPRRGRGRIYHVRYVGKKAEKPPSAAKERDLPTRLEDLVALLDSESYAERCRAQQAIERRGKDGANAVKEAIEKERLGVRGRSHAVWLLAKRQGEADGGLRAGDWLFEWALGEREPRVRVQLIRALTDLCDPVLVRHRLDADPARELTAAMLTLLARGRDPRVQLEAIIALGRLRFSDPTDWLRENVKKPDPALAHAAQWAMRRSGNWPAVLKLLDEAESEPYRAVARRTVAGQYEKVVVDGLIERLKKATDPARRREYAGLLARVARKPATPWTYWGFRPPPRPANTVAWERTEAIDRALDTALAASDGAVRRDVLRLMLREKVPARAATLGRWLKEERQPDAVADLLAALRDLPAGDSRPHLESVFEDKKHTAASRLLAVTLFVQGLDAAGDGRLLPAAEAVEDGPVLAELLRAMGTRKVRGATPFLLRKLTSSDAEVRARALVALAETDVAEAREPVRKLLADTDARVRSAAALAAGRMALRPAGDQLLKLARDPEAEVRRSSLEALRRLREPRAVAVAVTALGDPEMALKALECLGELGGPDQAGPVADLARRHPSAEILAAAGKVLTGWRSQEGLSEARRQELDGALAQVHGGSGVPLAWHVQGPMRPAAADETVGQVTAGRSLPTAEQPAKGWKLVLSAGLDARVPLGPVTADDDTWLAYSEVVVPESAKVEFLTTSSGLVTVWLNGDKVYQRDRPVVAGPYPDRFEATLAKGRNRLLVRLSRVKGAAEFQLRFRRKSATADHERLTLAALSRAGNPEHGRQVFLNAEKSLCVKCHRVGDQGERIGPELTGLGSRFSKAYIVESILEPSRTIAPSFETVVVSLKNGKVLSGIKVAETETTITLADNQAAKQVVARADIDEVQKGTVSTMPEGLEKRLTEDEFVDLVSFLMSLKEPRGPGK
jgi:putative membrane-bound dehydrogenase-like protein